MTKQEGSRLPLLAQSGHPSRAPQCPLSGVKQTSDLTGAMSAFDPKRTFTTVRDGLRRSEARSAILAGPQRDVIATGVEGK